MKKILSFLAGTMFLVTSCLSSSDSSNDHTASRLMSYGQQLEAASIGAVAARLTGFSDKDLFRSDFRDTCVFNLSYSRIVKFIIVKDNSADSTWIASQSSLTDKSFVFRSTFKMMPQGITVSDGKETKTTHFWKATTEGSCQEESGYRSTFRTVGDPLEVRWEAVNSLVINSYYYPSADDGWMLRYESRKNGVFGFDTYLDSGKLDSGELRWTDGALTFVSTLGSIGADRI